MVPALDNGVVESFDSFVNESEDVEEEEEKEAEEEEDEGEDGGEDEGPGESLGRGKGSGEASPPRLDRGAREGEPGRATLPDEDEVDPTQVGHLQLGW